jgi:hypothetical protein
MRPGVMYTHLPRRKQRVDGSVTSWLTRTLAPFTRVSRVGALGQGSPSLVHCPHPSGPAAGCQVLVDGRQLPRSTGRPIEGENKAPFKSLPARNPKFSEPIHTSKSAFMSIDIVDVEVKGASAGGHVNASHVMFFDLTCFGLAWASLGPATGNACSVMTLPSFA